MMSKLFQFLSVITVFGASPDNAFPGVGPRPVAPDLIFKSFTFPSAIQATHLRLVAITNQCQGGPDFQGDQDNDPLNNSDCTTDASTRANMIRVAELEAFSTAL